MLSTELYNFNIMLCLLKISNELPVLNINGLCNLDLIVLRKDYLSVLWLFF